MRRVILALIVCLSFTGIAAADGRHDNPCGMSGCYKSFGAMKATIEGYTAAYGDQVLAGSGGSYNLTTNLGDDGVDYFNLNGGWNALSEGTDWKEAGGFGAGEAKWGKWITW